ncbi:unnamed protein product [Allacma fusca]|uniref:NADP-dependent oxidoreductase domain-containing protein n=1 Tax=Allacma fusca TaxID=39272 RepID=A0A8J2LNV0_9HEXA|nr:unnamed protein product [Allacma fusca]
MSPKVPNVKLNNGREMPIFGLGTWKALPGEVTQAVKDAIDAGYRHIDCAMLYANEPEVGEAIKAKIDEGVVVREDLFITSKLWSNYHSKALVIPTLKQTLKDLGLDEQLDRLLKVAKIQPANNQFEVSPYLTNLKPGASPDDPKVLEDPLLKQLGEKHSKSPAQIILRWAIHHDIIIIPKSTNKKRLEDNINIFDFTLSTDEISQIDGLNRNFRTATMSFCSTHNLYPFNIEY